jgi:hypothetical protein
VAWFFRAIEAIDGTWSCRRGLQEFDQHPTLDAALQHLVELAQQDPPAWLFAHWQDGRVERLGDVGDGSPCG